MCHVPCSGTMFLYSMALSSSWVSLPSTRSPLGGLGARRNEAHHPHLQSTTQHVLSGAPDCGEHGRYRSNCPLGEKQTKSGDTKHCLCPTPAATHFTDGETKAGQRNFPRATHGQSGRIEICPPACFFFFLNFIFFFFFSPSEGTAVFLEFNSFPVLSHFLRNPILYTCVYAH